jgi:hypothetical protein
MGTPFVMVVIALRRVVVLRVMVLPVKVLRVVALGVVAVGVMALGVVVRRAVLVVSLLTAFVMGSSLSGSARAQSIRDVAREHVTEGLEQQPKKAKKPKRRAAPQPPPRAEPPPAAAPAPVAAPGSLRDTAAPAGVNAPVPPPPAAPRRGPERVFGRDLVLDPRIGGGFRGWVPDQYPLVSVDHAEYYTWSLELKARLFGFLRLHRGYYESNGLRGPRTNEAVVAAQIGELVPKAAWLLGTIGVPLSKRWETVVQYETRSFSTAARPEQPVAVIPRSTSPDTDLASIPRTTEPLRMVSGFETLVLGVRYSHDAEGSGLLGESQGKLPPMYLGVGFTQYRKPYQLRVASSILNEALFDARFRGAGLAYGLTTTRKADQPYVVLDMQLGAGEVSLLDDLTVNELLPDDWLIGYVQGNATAGYILPVLRTRPGFLLTGEVSVGGASFFYFHLKGGDDAPSLPLNWDFLWSVHLSGTVPL